MRRIIGIALAATLLAAGCGTTEEPAGADREEGGEPITVTDSRGKEVTLDGPAKRVAGTEWNVVEHLVSLGVMPVGVADVKGYGQWVSSEPLSATKDGDTPKDIGVRGEPSIDTLGALDLDLVVVTAGLPEGALAQIEERTPVIVVKGSDAKDSIGQMFKNLDLIAKATGTQDRAAELKADFDKKVADGAAAVEQAGAKGEQLAFSDSFVESGTVNIRPFAKGSLVADVLAKIGLPNAWPMAGDPEYGLAKADVEGLTVLGDVRFWYIANDAFGDPYAEELASNAIWTNLPFVKSGKVHRLPDSIWMFGGPTSMSQLIDAAVDALG